MRHTISYKNALLKFCFLKHVFPGMMDQPERSANFYITFYHPEAQSIRLTIKLSIKSDQKYVLTSRSVSPEHNEVE